MAGQLSQNSWGIFLKYRVFVWLLLSGWVTLLENSKIKQFQSWIQENLLVADFCSNNFSKLIFFGVHIIQIITTKLDTRNLSPNLQLNFSMACDFLEKAGTTERWLRKKKKTQSSRINSIQERIRRYGYCWMLAAGIAECRFSKCFIAVALKGGEKVMRQSSSYIIAPVITTKPEQYSDIL